MSTHTVHQAAGWAYLVPEVYDDPASREVIVAAVVSKCQGAVAAAGMVLLPDSMPVVHWQTQTVPIRGEPSPDIGIPYLQGDIIPPGRRVMWGLQVVLDAYDPEEHT